MSLRDPLVSVSPTANQVFCTGSCLYSNHFSNQAISPAPEWLFFLFNVFKYLENLRALDPLVLEEQAVVPCICREFDPCPLERVTNGRNQ